MTGTGWTVETLKALVDERDARYAKELASLKTLMDERDVRYMGQFKASDTAVANTLAAQKEAVTKAEIAVEKRLEGVNEFRAQLADQQRSLMPRQEAEVRLSATDARLKVAEENVMRFAATKSGGREMWAYIIGGVGVMLAVASFVMRAFGK